MLELSYTSQFNIDLNFFSLLDMETDYTTINQYQSHMKIFIDKSKAIYYCYNLFMFVEKLSMLNANSKLMLKFLLSDLIMLLDLENNGIIDRKFRFYK